MANPGNAQPPAKKRHPAKIPLLVLALLVSAGWIVLGSPGTWLTLLLLLAAALSVGSLAAIFLPRDLTPAQKNFVGAAVGCATLLIAYLAVPGVRPADDESKESSGETTASVSPSMSSSPSDELPFTWDLGFQANAYCEGFAVKNSVLKSLPKGDKLNAEWVYGHGGATNSAAGSLTLQGKSDKAVVIQNLRIVDLQIEKASSDLSEIYPCNPGGGPIEARYFEVILDEPPGIRQYPARDVEGQLTERIKKFPFKITEDDVEYFALVFGSNKTACICSWKLAIDWTSEGRSGRTILDRKFGSIRTFLPDPHTQYGYYERGTDTDEWNPQLPDN